MNKKRDTKWLTWYQQFDAHHGLAKRKEWYSDSTMAYRWARPRYPDALIDRVLEQAHPSEALASGVSDALSAEQPSLLEVGCGPGIATESFAARDLSIVAIEPSAAACELARKSCRKYEAVTVIKSTFEQYELQQQYDAVLAATSFHWISPDVACSKAAAALKPNGSLILLWATPPQPSAELSESLQSIYDRHNLSELSEGQLRSHTYYQQNFDQLAEIVNGSGFFESSGVTIETHHSTYSIEKYLALLSTLSPYIAIESQLREELFVALGDRLAQTLETGALETTHWFASQVAPLKASA